MVDGAQKGYFVNLCYCDESGMGEEPIATMVGVVVDAQRMHLTKAHWQDLLDILSKITGRQIVEIHTADFYAGNGVWRGVDGPTRALVIDEVFEWLVERKHEVVYTSVVKQEYYRAYKDQEIPDELNTIWRFLGFHLVLSMQKTCQREQKNKGHTIFVFDNEEREQVRFTDVILRPPEWSDEYYQRTTKQPALDQIVDVPYWGDSRQVVLIQVADFLAFFLRRYAELKEGLRGPDYKDEEVRLDGWMKQFAGRSIGRACIYPKTGRGYAENLFYDRAPKSIREL